MKTKEELDVLKEEVVTMSQKLAELTEEELRQVTGGITDTPDCVFTKNEAQSGGAIPASFQQNSPAQEDVKESDPIQFPSASDSTTYHPISKPNRSGGSNVF